MTQILLTKIRIDGGTQPRKAIDTNLVSEYQAAIDEGATLPQLQVVFDGKDYWLWDGFHRFFAHQNRQAKKVDVVVTQGTQRDAVLLSCGANAEHGKRRTNADKRSAVATLLEDDEWVKKSNRWIAEQCKVHPSTVDEIRRQLPETGSSDAPPARTGLDGKTRKPPAKPAPEPTTTEQAAADAGLETEEEITPDEAMAEHNREIESWCRAVVKSLDDLVESKWLDKTRRGIIRDSLKSAAGTARQAKAHGLCPKCDGDGCIRCQWTGFLPKADHERVTAQTKGKQ